MGGFLCCEFGGPILFCRGSYIYMEGLSFGT